MDTQSLMKNTDNGFKILTARLNRIMYSRGENRIDPTQEQSFHVKNNGGIYINILTHLKEPPLYLYIRKKNDLQNLVVYYSKFHKHPDFEHNQGMSTASKIMIGTSAEAIFSNDYLYLGLFSSTGCSFTISCSFKHELISKTLTTQ